MRPVTGKMMSSHSSFILACILTVHTYCSAASPTIIGKDDVNEKCNIKIFSNCSDNGKKINTSSFSVTDTETGTVKVILPRSFERRLKLMLVLEQGQIDICTEAAMVQYSVYECEMPTGNVSSECSYQEVIFRYLYSSHYAVLDDKQPESNCLAHDDVKTNYTPAALKEDCSLNVGVDLVQEKYTVMSLNISKFLHNSVLKFIVNNSECTPDTRQAEFWWRVKVKEDLNENIIIEKNETQNRTVDCTIVLNEEMGIRQLRCKVDWPDILCVMMIGEKSASPIFGGYCNKLGNTFPNTIAPLKPYDTIEHIYPAAEISRTTNTMALMFIPLTAVFICVCLSMYFSDTKDLLFKEEGSNSSKISPDLKCKVLLLYPQDCDSFMDTMKSLQNFLQSFNYFEVYDYFDPKRFGEIACDPQGWISKLLSQKDVRIILAETDTALLHQLAIAKKCVVNYVSPLPYSNLFAYGLQHLLHSLRPQEYSHIFLIRFGENTQDKQNLKLSRYRRYRLPEHINNLISCMSNCNIISFKEVEESLEMRRLKHSIDKFREFQQHNPNYHAEICNNLTKVI